VGDSNAAPGRRASLQEILSDEVADEREALEKINRRLVKWLQ